MIFKTKRIHHLRKKKNQERLRIVHLLNFSIRTPDKTAIEPKSFFQNRQLCLAMDFVDTLFFSLSGKMVLNKVSSVQSKFTMWDICYNDNVNITQKRRRKNNRTFRSAASTSLAIICFQVLIVNGSELTPVRTSRPNVNMYDQTRNIKSATSALRNVRREVMLEEAFMHIDFFSTSEPTTALSDSPALTSTQSATLSTSDISEKRTRSNATNSDDMEADPSLDISVDDDYFYNATDESSDETSYDDFFEDTRLVPISREPSEMSSASPSETAFLPVAILEVPEDPIDQLGLVPSSEPTDIKTSDRIDQTAVPSPGFFLPETGAPSETSPFFFWCSHY
mmetsp:Transcript_26376/g.61959  ORF Transcript_26376/g.61959 Transcript_26376/m.61959 type:complete len:337 (+) Transcript_26376:3-1013(+)